MPKRIPLNTIILQRDGQKVVPPLNKPFDFTAEELKMIASLSPDAIGKVPVDGDDGQELVTLTQAEIDDKARVAAEEAVAKFKKEQGIKDEPKDADTGTGGANDSKKSDANTKDPKGAKSTGSGSKSSADDDI